MATPIIKGGTRVLRPSEWKRLLDGIDKTYHITMAQALMYTGLRYIEAKRLQKMPKWFDGDFIKITVGEAVFKEKIKEKERWVRLNQVGKMAVKYFIELDKPLPSNQTWRQNMIRWAKSVRLDPVGLCPKTTRKTWESWLCFYYPDQHLAIMQSQGHDKITSIEHYLNMPFTYMDKVEMSEFVGGWKVGSVEP